MDQLRPVKTLLFTPGPTPVPDAVLRAMSAPIIHHRSPEWQAVFTGVLEKIPAVFGTQPGSTMMFTTSGTGGMESCIVNLANPGDEIIVSSFGRFGERWANIAAQYGITVHHHKTERGQRPDPDEVAAFAAQHPNAVAFFTTQSETATGTVSDPGAVIRAVRAARGDRILCVLDAISGLAAAPTYMDEWGYDAIVAGSQKALMAPPGLAFVAISAEAEARANETTTPRFYLDWPKSLKAHRKSPAATPFTPASTIVQGLDVALDLILEEGLENVYARHVALGRGMRAGVKALGFETFGPDHDSSCVVTAVRVPEGLDGARIPKDLRPMGVTIAGGQDDLAGQIFRLGHCGWVNAFDVITCIAALERGLAEQGWDFEAGAGVAAAQASFVGVKAAL